MPLACTPDARGIFSPQMGERFVRARSVFLLTDPFPYLLSSPFFLSFPILEDTSYELTRGRTASQQPALRPLLPLHLAALLFFFIHFLKNRFPLQLLRFSNQLFGRIIATTGL